MDALVKNAADPEQVTSAKEKEGRGRDLALDDLHTLLKLPAGRRFLWRLLSLCGVNSLSYLSGDANHTIFREGMRNVGLTVLSDITDNFPDGYLNMIKESQGEMDG